MHCVAKESLVDGVVSEASSNGAKFTLKKKKIPTKKKYLSNQNKTWPGSIKQRAEQIGAIVKGGQICCLSRLAVSSRKDLM